MATLRIDAFGRLVLPKLVRDRWGLQAGAELELAETDDGVVLRPVAVEPVLKRNGTLLVFHGELGGGAMDIVQAIDDDRAERDRHILGL